MEYLVLWKDYSRLEASWEIERNITAAALRYYYPVKYAFTCMLSSTHTHPNPQPRVMLDSVDNLKSSICSSLKAGTIRRCNFTCTFRRDVFNCLFGDRGRVIGRKRGRLYDEADFDGNYFDGSSFVIYNKDSEGYCVDFPIYMYSYVKFSSVCYSVDGKKLNRHFSEVLSVTLCKKCC